MARYLVTLGLIAAALYCTCVVCEAVPANKTREENALIFPGTKWCGKGNDADSFDQLGVHNETDLCCREHDHCPDYIAPFGTKHGLFNFFPIHIFKCSCETKFFNCLLKIKNPIAKTVGRMYFNGIRSPCFNIVTKKVCVEASSWLGWFGFGGCSKYATKTTGKMSWVNALISRSFPRRRFR